LAPALDGRAAADRVEAADPVARFDQPHQAERAVPKAVEAGPLALPRLPAVAARRPELPGEGLALVRQLEPAFAADVGLLVGEDQPAVGRLALEGARGAHVVVDAADAGAVLGQFHQSEGGQPFASIVAHACYSRSRNSCPHARPLARGA